VLLERPEISALHCSTSAEIAVGALKFHPVQPSTLSCDPFLTSLSDLKKRIDPSNPFRPAVQIGTTLPEPFEGCHMSMAPRSGIAHHLPVFYAQPTNDNLNKTECCPSSPSWHQVVIFLSSLSHYIISLALSHTPIFMFPAIPQIASSLCRAVCGNCLHAFDSPQFTGALVCPRS
jgi:hypothetical protein